MATLKGLSANYIVRQISVTVSSERIPTHEYVVRGRLPDDMGGFRGNVIGFGG
jgi:hypothetical protein